MFCFSCIIFIFWVNGTRGNNQIHSWKRTLDNRTRAAKWFWKGWYFYYSLSYTFQNVAITPILLNIIKINLQNDFQYLYINTLMSTNVIVLLLTSPREPLWLLDRPTSPPLAELSCSYCVEYHWSRLIEIRHKFVSSQLLRNLSISSGLSKWFQESLTPNWTRFPARVAGTKLTSFLSQLLRIISRNQLIPAIIWAMSYIQPYRRRRRCTRSCRCRLASSGLKRDGTSPSLHEY